MSRRAIIIAVIVPFVLTSAGAFGAGRYELGWWREWGMYENGGPGGGNHSIHVWVFNESGTMMPGVDLYTSWGVLQGTTNSEGRCEIVLWTADDRDVRVGAPGAVDSDVTPIMTTARWPNWGHYSYDCGFLYKADAGNPGEFDQDLWGTVNVRDGGETDCPYTKSLVYNSINWQNTYSDQFSLGHWSNSFAQTFQATAADRIVGVMLQGTIGGNYILTWTAEIRQGGPTGPVVFSKSTPFDVFPFRYFIPFGVNDCPVIAGETYAITLSRPGGLNAYHVANIYSNGQYYEVTTPYSDYDLVGFVLGMRYWEPGTGLIRGTVEDSLGQPLRNATVTTSPGSYSDDTNEDGEYFIWNVPAGTYDVTASKEGYNPQTQSGRVVTEGETTVVDFALTSTRGSISGVVSAAEGGVIEGAFVQTSPGGYGGVSEADGSYDIINVPAGTYSVTAYAPTRTQVTQAGKVVSAGATTTVNFTLAKSGKVAHIVDNFNGNYVFGWSGDYLEESFRMGFDNHRFIQATAAGRTRLPHSGTDSAQQISVSENNDQYVTYFESKDPVTGDKNFNLVQYAAAQGWEPINVSQPITYILYAKGHNDAFNPDDPNAYWRQSMAVHRPSMYIGVGEASWKAANNDTWQMLKTSVTGLLDNQTQWITFETWYPAQYRSMIYAESWMVWENLMIEYTPQSQPTIQAWRSVRSHDTTGIGLTLDKASTTGTTEPRTGGILRIEVDFDQAPTNVVGTVQVQNMTDGGSIPADSTNLNGTMLEILFNAGTLPDVKRYRIDLAGNIPGITGDTDCVFCALAGDVDGDRNVTLTDALAAKDANGQPPASYPRCDVDHDNNITLTDALVAKDLNGHIVP